LFRCIAICTGTVLLDDFTYDFSYGRFSFLFL
jgi:hypothetical protein